MKNMIRTILATLMFRCRNMIHHGKEKSIAFCQLPTFKNTLLTSFEERSEYIAANSGKLELKPEFLSNSDSHTIII